MEDLRSLELVREEEWYFIDYFYFILLSMYKNIVVEPLLYKTIQGSVHYGVNIFDGNSNHEIWKTFP